MHADLSGFSALTFDGENLNRGLSVVGLFVDGFTRHGYCGFVDSFQKEFKVQDDLKMLTKAGLSVFGKPMTKAQAKRWGDRYMPADLKAAGFETIIFTATPEINGWTGYRINYGMRTGRPRDYSGKLI